MLERTVKHTGLMAALRAVSHMATMIGLVTLAVAWSGIGLYLAGQRAATQEAAEQNAGNLARAFEEQIVRSIKSVDQALLFVRTQFEREPDTFDLQTWGQNDYYLSDLAVQLAVINPDGRMRASNVGASTAPIDLSDREHFRFHVGRAGDDLFISKPVLGRVTQKWTIQLTRKLRKPDGSFGGVLVGSIDPNYLAQFYNSIDIGRGGITLLGTDGIIRARGSRNADVLGRELTNKLLLDLAAKQPAGTYMGQGAVDGVQRLVSYRKVKDFPLIVTVALDPVEIFEHFEESRANVLRAGAIFTLFVFLAIAWATRQKIRLDATRVALVDKSETLGLTLANMSQGVVVIDAMQDVVVLNEQAVAILELAGEAHSVPFPFARLKALGFEERAAQDLDTEGLPIATSGTEWLMRSGKIIEARQATLPSGGVIITLSDVTRRRHYQQNLEEALERAETASRARTSFLANMSHEMRTPLNGVISMTDLLAETNLDEDQRHYVHVAKSSAEHLLELIDDILDVSKLEADQVQFEAIRFDLHAVIADALEITAPKAHEKALAVGAFVAPQIPRKLIGDPGRIRQILINLIGNSVKFTSKGHVHLSVDLVEQDEQQVVLEMLVEDTGIGIAADKINTLFKDFSQIDSSISRRYGGTGLGLSICRKLSARMGGSISVESEVGIGTQFRVCLPLRVAEGNVPAVPRLAGIRVAILSRSEHFSMLVHRQILAEGGEADCFMHFAEAQAWLETRVSGRGRPILLVDVDAVDNRADIPFEGAAFAVLPVSANSAGSFVGARMDRLLHKPLLVDSLVAHLLAATLPESGNFRPRAPMPTPDAALCLPLDILVAEDNVTNQFAIRRILENMGARVTVVDNGLEAVAAVQRAAFDVVLMDMMMPEMDGLSATREIRALPGEISRIPILALTANAFKEDQLAALEAGMSGYTTKPTNRQKLHHAVMDVLGSHAPAAPEPMGEVDCDIDPAIFGSFIEEMGEDANVAIDQFLLDIESRFAKMQAAHHAAPAVERDSHAIKSAAGLLGLKRLSAAAAALETRCKADRSASFDDDVLDMRARFEAARTALQRAA